MKSRSGHLLMALYLWREDRSMADEGPPPVLHIGHYRTLHPNKPPRSITMGEARTRPARERERFIQIARANLWFWNRVSDPDDIAWDVIREWELLPHAVQIRRWRAAQPQESCDAGEHDQHEPGTKGTATPGDREALARSPQITTIEA